MACYVFIADIVCASCVRWGACNLEEKESRPADHARDCPFLWRGWVRGSRCDPSAGVRRSHHEMGLTARGLEHPIRRVKQLGLSACESLLIMDALQGQRRRSLTSLCRDESAPLIVR